MSGWEELFSGDHGGRPYYHNKETGAIQWAEPAEYRKEQEAVDVAMFGLQPEVVRSLMRALRTAQMYEATWGPARDLLVKVLGNIVNQPHVEKFRQIKKKETFNTKLGRAPGCADLLAACGFIDSAEAVTLPPGKERMAPDTTTTLTHVRSVK